MPKINWTYLRTVLHEIEINQKKEFPTKVITSIKNLMSDVPHTQKINDLFYKM